MSTDSTVTDSEFVERLLAAVDAYLAENPHGPYSDATAVDTRDRKPTAILVDGPHARDLVIVAIPDETSPGDGDVLEAACEATDTAIAVATCDGSGLFLFDVRDGADEIDHYLNLGARSLSDAVASLLDAVVRLEREGTVPEQSERTRLCGALRSALDRGSRALETAAREAYGSDPAFTAAFEEWVESNGDGDRDGAFAVAATRYATLLLQRLLRSERDRRSGPEAAEAGSADDRLGDAVAAIGHEADDGSAGAALFAAFPIDEATRRGLARAFRIVERAPAAEGRGCPIGKVYEEYIPASSRDARGQFYTHPTIAATLVRWALDADVGRDRLPRVLDPAAGSGVFAVEAFHALADRFPTADEDELLDRIHAVDVERFPLRLTALNLAGLGSAGESSSVRAYHGSFFDLDPTTDVSTDDRIELLGEDDRDEIGRVDAVVGNPPYVEASDLSPSREHFRAHLRELGPDGAAPYANGDDGIGRNADAYVYFATHATRFLREGGRLAFVAPTKWMMSRYGEQFQGFLHDHYRIEAVVGFDARAFEDALVDTALVFLQRCDDEQARRENVVRFVQLHEAVGPETLLGALDRDVGAVANGELSIERAEHLRIVGVEQSTLAEETKHGKIAHYLVAPPDLLALMESPELTDLGDLADVGRGAMTGSTAFFFPDEDDVAAHGIEADFLRPALKSMRGHETIACDEADVDRWFVDVHEYVGAVRDSADGQGDEPLEARVKRALEEDGYDGLRSWIRRAEEAGEHRGATCERRDVWFDFGEPPRPDILFQKLLRERLFSIYNRVNAVPSNAVDCVDARAGVDATVLFGVLNSSIVRAIMEVWGRNEAGMLQLMTYETESLPVPDVRGMSDGERDRIAAVVDDLLERGTSEFSDVDRDRLDAAVLGALDSVDASVARIQAIQRALLRRRVGAGDTAEVLVNEPPKE